jgi:hypothetical protein
MSVLLLADSFGRATAWATRIRVGIFLVFFSAYDTLAEIGTWLAMRSARDVAGTAKRCPCLKDWPGLPAPFALSIVGAGGWILAVDGLAQAARHRGTPQRVWSVLGLTAVFLWLGILIDGSVPERNQVSDVAASLLNVWSLRQASD